jgi:alkylation response protein AidB-like acyl-CoA dehydrogenase
MILTSANSGMCTSFAGLAQAAYELALDYAKQRVQGGIPIIAHQNVKLKLFEMFKKVESVRAYARRLSDYNAANPPGSPQHAVAGKVLATETATQVAAEAIQVFGGNGLTKEYPIEKIYRDAKASMIEDGENSALALSAAALL